MTITTALLAYLVAASLLTITPGLDTALVLRALTSGGPRRAMLAALGIGAGCLAWGAAVSTGLGALLAASPLAYTMLKWAGAAYLFWMGLNLLLRPRTSLDLDGAPVGEGETAGQSFRQGFVTNLLNPKIGLFYVTFLPQFIPMGVSAAAFSFLLAVIHVVLGLLWFGLIVAASLPLTRFLRRPATVRRLDRASGAVFMGFAAKLALSR